MEQSGDKISKDGSGRSARWLRRENNISFRVALYTFTYYEPANFEIREAECRHQIEEMRQYANQQGWAIVGEYFDSVRQSDSLPQGLHDLYELVERGECDVILVPDQVTLPVNKKTILVNLSRHKVKIISMRHPLQSALTHQMIGGKAERTLLGLPQMTPPYGYLTYPTGPDAEPQLNPTEVEVVQKIFRIYSAGTASYEDVADQLNKDGYLPRKGNSFTPMFVAQILRDPLYCGKIIDPNQPDNEANVVLAHDNGIVSEEEFEACQQVPQHRLNKYYGKQSKHEYLLSEMCTCMFCTRLLRGQSAAAGSYYREQFKTVCPNSSIGVKTKEVEQQVDTLLDTLLPFLEASDQTSWTVRQLTLYQTETRHGVQTGVRRDILRQILQRVEIDTNQNRLVAFWPTKVFLPIFRQAPHLVEVETGQFIFLPSPDLVGKYEDGQIVLPPITQMPSEMVAWPFVSWLPQPPSSQRITPALSISLKQGRQGGLSAEEMGLIVEVQHPGVPSLRVDQRKWTNFQISRLLSSTEDVPPFNLPDRAVSNLFTSFFLTKGNITGRIAEAARVVKPDGGWVLTEIIPVLMPGHWFYRYFPETRTADLSLLSLLADLQKVGFQEKVLINQTRFYQPVGYNTALMIARERDRFIPILQGGLSDEGYEAGLMKLEKDARQARDEGLLASHFCLTEIIACRVKDQD